MSGQSDGLTDTLVSVMTAHAAKSSAHALTVVSAIVKLLLLAMALILIIERWGLKRRQSAPMLQFPAALDARQLANCA